MARVELAGLLLGDPPHQWGALGFQVEGDRFAVGGVTVELAQTGEGIVGWRLREGSGERARAAKHPNGVLAVDHVVLLTGDFEATGARLADQGMAFRRVREVPARPDRPGFRQGFRRLGPAILEVVEAPGASGERFWGITFTVEDLDALAQRLGPLLSEPRPAVQPGRRIAALRSAEAGIGCAVAFMTPEPADQSLSGR